MNRITLLVLVNIMACIAHASVSTPNMSLVQPTIGVDSGLTWEQATNSNSTIIDQHNHTPGYGVQIPPAGLNLSSDLTFQGNSATNLKASIYTPQSSFSTLYSIYTIGNDLYYNDGAGNVIRLTSGGVVNATASGISDGSGNAAAFVGGVLVVQNTSTAPDNIQAGSLLMGNVGTASSKYLTLNPPAAMATNIAETLPTIPSVTNLMTMSSAGNMAAVTNVDNSTLQLTSNTLAIKAQGVVQNDLATRAIGSTVSAGGVALSSSSANFSTTSTTYVSVTNLSVTITTTGRPVQLVLISDTNLTHPSYISAPASDELFIQIENSTLSTIVGTYSMNGGASVLAIPSSSVSSMDTNVAGLVNAGTYTYIVRAKTAAGGTAFVSYVALLAYEI